MTFFSKLLGKGRLPESIPPVLDPSLGKLAYDGECWFVGAFPFEERNITIFLAVDGESPAAGALSSARRIASEQTTIIDQALCFLADNPGFGGLEKIRAIFSLREVVMNSSYGSFWLVFHCSEDRDPEAIWRVHFEDWIPHSQGRDS